jgi:hypothetical protein
MDLPGLQTTMANAQRPNRAGCPAGLQLDVSGPAKDVPGIRFTPSTACSV